MPQLRLGQLVARLDLMAMHQWHDRDGIPTAWDVRAQDEGLLVGVVGVRVPPGPLKRPAREWRGPGGACGEGIPAISWDVTDGPRLDTERVAARGLLCQL